MIKKYDIFISENMNHAKSIISKKMDAYEKLKTLLSANIGYIGKFTEYLMHENIPYSELESLYKKLLDLKSKNININIQDFTYEKLLDKIEVDENNVLVNKLINQFPSEQKKLAKTLLDKNSDDNYGSWTHNSIFNIFLKASKKPNLEFLVSKISRYKTSDDLKNALSIFCKDSKNDKESIKNTLKEMKSSVVYEDDNYLIAHVDNIEDIKILGSDSSWCILQKSQWDSYTKGRKQFILYDYSKEIYDPKFKVGFTLNLDGTIYAAHDLLDKSYDKKELKELIEGKNLVKSVYKETDFKTVKNITSLKDWVNESSKEDIFKNLNSIISKLVDSKNNAIKGFTVPRYDIFNLLLKRISNGKYIPFKSFDNYPLFKEILISKSSTIKINRYSAIPGIFDFYSMNDNIFFEALQDNAWSDFDILNGSKNLELTFKYSIDFSEKEIFRFEDETMTILYHKICKIIDTYKSTKKKDIDNKNILIAYAYLFNYKLKIDNRHFNETSIKFSNEFFKYKLGILGNEISLEDKTIWTSFKKSLFERIRDGKFKNHQIFWENNMKIFNMIKDNILHKDNITINIVDDKDFG